MKKTILKNQLLSYPKFSSDWIDTAVDLVVDYGWEIKSLEPFNNDQLKIIVECEKYNSNNNNKIDISVVANNDLNSTQMNIIMIALQNNIDIDIIKKCVNKNIPFSISNYVLQGVIEGKEEILNYIDGYNHEQIYEIYAGIHNEIDYKLYADPEIEAPMMGLIRHACELGLNAEYDKENKKLTIC